MGLIGIEYVGGVEEGGSLQESKVSSAKTVIGFARGRRAPPHTAPLTIKLCLYMCRLRLATLLFLSGQSAACKHGDYSSHFLIFKLANEIQVTKTRERS